MLTGRSSVYKFISSRSKYLFSFAIFSPPIAVEFSSCLIYRGFFCLPLTSFVFCVAPHRFCLQPFPRQFNRFVKFLLTVHVLVVRSFNKFIINHDHFSAWFCSTHSLPLSVRRYFCLLLLGLSGIVISTSSKSRAGFK